MKYQLELLLYLDKRRILHDMRNVCEETLKYFTEDIVRKFPPLRYLLKIDVMDLLNYSAELGTLLLNEPLKLQKMANELLFACLQSIDNDFYQYIKLAQVAVIVRLKNIPNFLKDSKKRKYDGVVVFKGLVIDITKTTSYVCHSVWSCPEQCEGNEVILQYIPKTPPKCYVCRSVLYENSGFRSCGDEVRATFKLNDELFCKKFTIVDDLIKLLKLGVTYSIHAIVLKKSSEVWYLEEIISSNPVMYFPVQSDIEELFAACYGLPWKFIYCLASTIGSNICPLSCFMNVKINLLMSVSSVKSHILVGSNILHVLASGYDTGYIGMLMVEAAKLADRHVSLGTSNTSTLTALLAASGGIFIMPLPLHAYNQKQHYPVLSAIETGEIPHNICNQVPLKCAVWAHGLDFKKIDFCNVSSIFGNSCRGDYNEYNDELSDYVLQQAVEPSKDRQDEIKVLKDIEYYLNITAGIKVTINVEAEKLLRSYFLAARKERPKTVTVSSMNALITVCITSAKLCRRSVANSTDAVFAIWLHVSGIPEPRFAPAEYLETPADIKKLQKVMTQFQCWLEEFTGISITLSQNS